jgi:hypothetical protein
MGSVDWAVLYINGSRDDTAPIVLPVNDPSASINAITMIRARATLTAHEIGEIGKHGTYYDLRIRLYEEDNSPWPWGDDTDDQIWQRRPRLQGIVNEVIDVSVIVPVLTLKAYGAEYYGAVKLYRRTNSGMTGLHSRRTKNTIKLKSSHLRLRLPGCRESINSFLRRDRDGGKLLVLRRARHWHIFRQVCGSAHYTQKWARHDAVTTSPFFRFGGIRTVYT